MVIIKLIIINVILTACHVMTYSQRVSVSLRHITNFLGESTVNNVIKLNSLLGACKYVWSILSTHNTTFAIGKKGISIHYIIPLLQ